MNQLEEIYNLKNDINRIKRVQDGSLDKNSSVGYKIEKNLLFGTKKWFDAIEMGEIPKHIVRGKIMNIDMSGHDDYPEFEIESIEGKTTWTRLGDCKLYEPGKSVELIYVEQKFKRPSDITGVISKCVIQIKIE